MARAPTAKEKYDRQKELARERQRKRRAQLTDEQLEAKRKYDRDRREKLKEENKIKTVADMTPRERRKMQKYWRGRNKVRSLKKKAIQEATANTPPDTPTRSPQQIGLSTQKKRGRRNVRKSKAKAYRKIKKQEETILQLTRRLEKYKKRLYRQKNKVNIIPLTNTSPSPRKKTMDLIGKEKVSPVIKKQLFLGFALEKQLKVQKETMKSSKKKTQHMHKVIGNSIFKKYRIQSYFKKLVPYKSNKLLSTNTDSLHYTRKEKEGVRQNLKWVLERFFEDDRISRMCPGKKDVVKKGAIKKQRRILLEPLKLLHKQFEEESHCSISLASFLRARPFWVTPPKKSDRETCACIKHSNMDLIFAAMKQAKVIREATPSELIKTIVCSTSQEECMMSTCQECKQKEIVFSDDSEIDFKIKYFQWKMIKEIKVIKNVKKTITKTVKVKKVENVSKVKSELQKQLIAFKKHVFFYKHQAHQMKTRIENVKPDELIFRIDFSENYVCKYEKEIQAVHFGASKRQLALNTGLIYFNENGTSQSECFASVSDNLDHQAHAVWGHMHPILKHYSSKFPHTKTITFFSDGPSNQYKNRYNIKLFKTIMPRHFKEVTTMTWNYTEAGHGKGPMDGVGGTLKREADRKVLYGSDITCAKEFVAALQDFNILLVEVPHKEIAAVKNYLLSLKVPPINGVMKVHQITHSRGVMFSRYLSCFECPPSQYCDHFTLSEVFADDCDDPDFNNLCPTKLSVEEVFTSSEDEEQPSTSRCPIPPKVKKIKTEPQARNENTNLVKSDVPFRDKIAFGQYVLVRLETDGKKSQTRDFIGICQSNLTNNEVLVMFMKNCTKEKSLYVYNEQDISTVSFDQILKVLPTPTILLKGNRAFYKFK